MEKHIKVFKDLGQDSEKDQLLTMAIAIIMEHLTDKDPDQVVEELQCRREYVYYRPQN